MKKTLLKKQLRNCLNCIVAVLLIMSLPVSSLAINPQPEPPGKPISVIIDGTILTLDVAPLLTEGRTFVPMRAIFEVLGASVVWEGATKTITATKSESTIVMQLGSQTAYLNGAPMGLDAPPRLHNSRTLVPLRFVGEALGAEVSWDGINRNVNIVTANQKAANVPDTSPKEPAPPGTKPTDPGPSTERPGSITLPEKPGTSKTEPSKTTNPLIPDLKPGTGDSTTGVGPGQTLIPVQPQPGYNLEFKPDLLDLVLLPNYDLQYDNKLIIADKLHASLLDVDVTAISKPTLDYMEYITFQGSQDGWGGCIGRSIVHVMNALNEMEHPYTPDLSFWYGHARQAQLWPNGGIDTKYLLETEGACTECSLPSDYDKAKFVDGKLDLTDMQWPTAANFYEASTLYKIKTYSDSILTPTVDGIKYLLYQCGPILAAGPFTIVQGENPTQGHCITIVGFDDNIEAFKCLNSWGDNQHGGDGVFELPYNKVAENIDWVRYIVDLPSNRHLTSHAYSARIDVSPIYGGLRRNLTIKIGVADEEPLIIWDTPCQVMCQDQSRRLCIDVPLPEYASQYWPPNTGQQWYVEVINNNNVYYHNDPDDLYGLYQVNEITFARLFEDSNGKLVTETFSDEDNVGETIYEGSNKFYVPHLDLIVRPIKPIKIK